MHAPVEDLLLDALFVICLRISYMHGDNGHDKGLLNPHSYVGFRVDNDAGIIQYSLHKQVLSQGGESDRSMSR